MPKTRSRQASRSIVGVTVWLRTNSRAWSVRKRFGSTESHRVSALVPKSVNHSGGNGLRMDGAPAYDGRAGAAADGTDGGAGHSAGLEQRSTGEAGGHPVTLTLLTY